MPVVGPMLATLVSMSPASQMPLACQGDYLGVTCQLDDSTGGSGSPELAGSLESVLEGIDAPAPQHAVFEVPAADPEQPDASAVLEPELALDSQAAAEPEPQAIVSVTADEDDDADEVGAWVDPEEAVTLRQIAETDRSDEDATADADIGERDPEAAPQPASASASTNDVASAEDGAPAEDERPAAVEPAQSPNAAEPGVNASPADTGLDTGPGLVSAEGRAWMDRFARVRQEVRDAFRPLRP